MSSRPRSRSAHRVPPRAPSPEALAAASHASILAELHALRSLMLAPPASGRAPRASSLRAPAAPSVASTAPVTAAAAAIPAPAPPSAPAPTLPASSPDALRRELRRVSEAYFSVLSEGKASRAAATAREAALSAEVTRLTQALAEEQRTTREAARSAGEVRAARLAAEAAASDAAAAAAREAEARRGRVAAERRAADSSALAQAADKRAAGLAHAAEEVDGARARVVGLASRAEDAEARVRALTSEREALLDFVQELQLKHAAALRDAGDARAEAATAEALRRELASARELGDAHERTAKELGSTVAELTLRAAEAGVEVEALLARAAQVDALEEERTQLRAAISQQAQQLKDASAAAVGVTRDAKRLARLERALAAYARVEAACASRTGQGFFGVNGLAYAMGLDVRPLGGGAGAQAAGGVASAAEAALARVEGDASIAAVTAGVAPSSTVSGGSSPWFFTSAPPPGTNSPPGSDGGEGAAVMGAYLGKVGSSLVAQARVAAEGEFEAERRVLQAQVDASLSRIREAEAAARAAAASVEVEHAWRARVEGAEAEVAALLEPMALTVSNDGDAPSEDAPASTDAAHLMSATAWETLPALVASLPRFAALLGRLRTELAAALRRASLACAEAQDLREELALARGEDVATAAARRVASRDVHMALREGKVQRDALRAENAALLVHVSAAEARATDATCAAAASAAALERTLAETKRIESAAADDRLRSETAVREANRARGEAALHESRWREAKSVNGRALALLARRDARCGRLQLRVGAAREVVQRLCACAAAAGVSFDNVLLEVDPALLRRRRKRESTGGSESDCGEDNGSSSSSSSDADEGRGGFEDGGAGHTDVSIVADEPRGSRPAGGSPGQKPPPQRSVPRHDYSSVTLPDLPFYASNARGLEIAKEGSGGAVCTTAAVVVGGGPKRGGGGAVTAPLDYLGGGGNRRLDRNPGVKSKSAPASAAPPRVATAAVATEGVRRSSNTSSTSGAVLPVTRPSSVPSSPLARNNNGGAREVPLFVSPPSVDRTPRSRLPSSLAPSAAQSNRHAATHGISGVAKAAAAVTVPPPWRGGASAARDRDAYDAWRDAAEARVGPVVGKATRRGCGEQPDGQLSVDDELERLVLGEGEGVSSPPLPPPTPPAARPRELEDELDGEVLLSASFESGRSGGSSPPRSPRTALAATAAPQSTPRTKQVPPFSPVATMRVVVPTSPSSYRGRYNSSVAGSASSAVPSVSQRSSPNASFSGAHARSPLDAVVGGLVASANAFARRIATGEQRLGTAATAHEGVRLGAASLSSELDRFSDVHSDSSAGGSAVAAAALLEQRRRAAAKSVRVSGRHVLLT